MLSNDVHAAIIAQLQQDAALQSMLGSGSGVVDAMPVPRKFPFALFASAESTDRSTDLVDGTAHTILFEIWSRAANRSECVSIAERIETLLLANNWHAAETDITTRSRLGCVTTHDRQSRAFVARLRIRLTTEPK
ncbi:MAG: DUF3168 domain-containing protein [Pseudomonadota bacterium]